MKSTTHTSKLTADAAEKIRRNPPQILVVPEVAAYFSQCERKTRTDIRLGRIPSFRLGGRVLVRLSDLERAIDNMVVGR